MEPPHKQSNIDSKSNHSCSSQESKGIEELLQEGNEGNKTEKINEGGISKRQQKKQQKRQRFKQMMKQKRQKQREKQKEKKKQMKQETQLFQPKNEQKILVAEQKNQRKRKDEYRQKMDGSLKVIIDLQFFDLMTEKEKSSLAKQLGYSHSLNRKMEKCFHFILTSATEQRMKQLNAKYNVDKFGITILENDLVDCFDREKLVYLTGDAQEELTEFKEDEIYIIGGIVDHNRLNRITIDYADSTKIVAKRLPMEGLRLKACVHLAVNHVWEWMLRAYNGASWKEALQAVIPDRKLHQLQEGEEKFE